MTCKTMLMEIVEQLEMCKYKDKFGNELKNNQAFVKLKECAEKESKECSVCHGEGVVCKNAGESWECDDCNGTGLE